MRWRPTCSSEQRRTCKLSNYIRFRRLCILTIIASSPMARQNKLWTLQEFCCDIISNHAIQQRRRIDKDEQLARSLPQAVYEKLVNHERRYYHAHIKLTCHKYSTWRQYTQVEIDVRVHTVRQLIRFLRRKMAMRCPFIMRIGFTNIDTERICDQDMLLAELGILNLVPIAAMHHLYEISVTESPTRVHCFQYDGSRRSARIHCFSRDEAVEHMGVM